MSSQKRKRSPDLTDSNVFRSPAIEDRSSTFIGYFSPTLKPEDLQRLDEYADASHKILGWRRESNQQAINGSTKYVTGNDDDGEKYGGKRVEKVLENMQVSGACVVARWYGGVLLGPVRFTHIENCAKEAISTWQKAEVEAVSKKRKAEEDAHEHSRLLKVLVKRDESIFVLRKLAAEKEEEVRNAESSTVEEVNAMSMKADAKASSPVIPATKPPMEYSAMPVDRLKALEKARDATLSFLLKRIDSAEAQLASLKNPEEESKPP